MNMPNKTVMRGLCLLVSVVLVVGIYVEDSAVAVRVIYFLGIVGKNNERTETVGSGVYLRTDNGSEVVVTARHVVIEKNLTFFDDNKKMDVNAALSLACVSQTHASQCLTVAAIYISADDDLAILLLMKDDDLMRKGWKSAHLRRNVLKKGMHVYTWGFPSDQMYLGLTKVDDSVLSVGYISALAGNFAGLDLHVHGGNSGGPLFVNGEPGVLAGIVIAKQTPWNVGNWTEVETLCAQLDKSTIMVGGIDTNQQLAKVLRKWSEIHSSVGIAIPVDRVRAFLKSKNLFVADQQLSE